MDPKDNEATMLKNFPTCPLCGADKGYEVTGFAKNYFQCRSCGAKWMSNFIKDQELKELTLIEPSSNGKGAHLKHRKFPIQFWQTPKLLEPPKMPESSEKREKPSQPSTAILISNEIQDTDIQQQIYEDLAKLNKYEADKGIGGFLTALTGTAIENTMVSLLHTIVNQNKIIIRQNELILRALKKIPEKTEKRKK